jgi:hypothetical protein
MCFYQGLSNPACTVPAVAYYGKIHGQKYTDKLVSKYKTFLPKQAYAAGFLVSVAVQRQLTIPVSKQVRFVLSPSTDTINYTVSF